MTTEKKAPTAEADVAKLAEVAHKAQRCNTVSIETKQEGHDALAQLRDLALLGVQVPGLVADNAALRYLFRRLRTVYGLSYAGFEPSKALLSDLDAAIFNTSPCADLLAEHEAKVSALQARVAELDQIVTVKEALVDVVGAERDAEKMAREYLEREREVWRSAESERVALRSTADRLVAREHELTTERDTAPEQRDALRAQVAKAQALATAVIRAGGGEEGERLANDIRHALSTPTAEEKESERCAYGNTCVCGECPGADE